MLGIHLSLFPRPLWVRERRRLTFQIIGNTAITSLPDRRASTADLCSFLAQYCTFEGLNSQNLLWVLYCDLLFVK